MHSMPNLSQIQIEDGASLPEPRVSAPGPQLMRAEKVFLHSLLPINGQWQAPQPLLIHKGADYILGSHKGFLESLRHRHVLLKPGSQVLNTVQWYNLPVGPKPL